MAAAPVGESHTASRPGPPDRFGARAGRTGPGQIRQGQAGSGRVGSGGDGTRPSGAARVTGQFVASEPSRRCAVHGISAKASRPGDRAGAAPNAVAESSASGGGDSRTLSADVVRPAHVRRPTAAQPRSAPACQGPRIMSRQIRKFRTDKFDTRNKRKF